VTLQKYFSHPSLLIFFFATPPIKLKPGPGRQMDLSGPGIDVKLKEKKRKKRLQIGGNY
jgi:hypothetical protein